MLSTNLKKENPAKRSICTHCHGLGHVEAKCFIKHPEKRPVCTHCHAQGHLESNCFIKFPGKRKSHQEKSTARQPPKSESLAVASVEVAPSVAPVALLALLATTGTQTPSPPPATPLSVLPHAGSRASGPVSPTAVQSKEPQSKPAARKGALAPGSKKAEPSQPRSLTICSWCNKSSSVALPSCGKCKQYPYCNATCQKEHWAAMHHQECDVTSNSHALPDDWPWPWSRKQECEEWGILIRANYSRITDNDRRMHVFLILGARGLSLAKMSHADSCIAFQRRMGAAPVDCDGESERPYKNNFAHLNYKRLSQKGVFF